MADLQCHEARALQSLTSGPVDLGSMDGWGKVAAALTYLELERRGYVEHSDGEAGPIWTLAARGQSFVRRMQDR